MSTTVQTLLFPRSQYSPSEARAWAKDHGYLAVKVDVQTNYIRLRQRDPAEFSRLRTVDFGKGIKAVVGVLKAKKNPAPITVRERRPSKASTTGAGLLVVDPRERKLLLVRAFDGDWGVPKGRIDPGEKAIEAALRELREEVSVDLDPRAVLGGPHQVGRMQVFVALAEDIPDSIPRRYLQTDEVVWAGMVPIEDALELVEGWQEPVLGLANEYFHLKGRPARRNPAGFDYPRPHAGLAKRKQFDEIHKGNDQNPLRSIDEALAEGVDSEVIREELGYALEWLEDERAEGERARNTYWYRAPYPELSVAKLLRLPGARGEHTRLGPDTPRVRELAEKMRAEGFDPKRAIQVFSWPDGSATIWEGNHRVRAAHLAGLKTIPVDWRYVAGAERDANAVHAVDFAP